MSGPIGDLVIGASELHLFADGGNEVQIRNGSNGVGPLCNIFSSYPTNSNHASTLSFLSGALAGIYPNTVVRAASTTVIHNLSKGLEAGDIFDGIVLVVSDIILLKNKTNQRSNGLYQVNQTGLPTRLDPSFLTYANYFLVLEGTVNNGTYWQSTGSYTGEGDNPIYNVDEIVFTSVPVWPAAPVVGSSFNGDLLGNHLSDSVNNIVIMNSPIDLNGHYLVDNESSTVSVACGFQASGSIASGGNIGMPNESAIYFATFGDPNWRMGRDLSAFTMELIYSNALQITVANSAGEGFAIGVHGGESILEFGSNGDTFVRNNIEAGTYTTHDEYFTYNGSQFIVNLVDSWGGLQVLGRSGGEASISLRPDNVEPGNPGTWALATNGSNMTAGADFAIYNANADTQPF